MRTRFRSSLSALVAAAAGGTLLAATALGATTTLNASLADAGGGAAGGSGTAEVTIDSDTGEVCWDLSVTGIGDVVASHIHEGAAGASGGVVVPLDTDGFSDTSTGCVTPTDADLAAIVANPAGYYVNIHTADYPAGAIRGQLAAAGGSPDTAMSRQADGQLPILGLLMVGAALALTLRLARRRA